MNRKLYHRLAQLVDAYHRCASQGSTDWQSKHEDSINSLVNQYLPSGCGFDNGTSIDLGASTGEKLVFATSYHHMNDNGFYDGWTDHTITVRPSLQFGFSLSVSGRNRNDIKSYISEVFHLALDTDVESSV